MTTIVTAEGQVTLPKQVLDAAGIKPGNRVEVSALGPGRILVKKVSAADEK